MKDSIKKLISDFNSKINSNEVVKTDENSVQLEKQRFETLIAKLQLFPELKNSRMFLATKNEGHIPNLRVTKGRIYFQKEETKAGDLALFIDDSGSPWYENDYLRDHFTRIDF